MKRGMIYLPLMIILFLTGCTKNTADPITLNEQILRQFNGNYSAQCVTKIKSNKTENEYLFTCEKNLDNFVLTYDDMRIIINGEVAICEKDGNQIEVKADSGEIAVSPTYFFNTYINSGGEIETLGDGYVLSCDIPNGNIYRTSMKMTLNTKLKPVRMIVLNAEGTTIVETTITEYKEIK